MILKTEADPRATRCSLKPAIIYTVSIRSTNQRGEQNGVDSGPTPFPVGNGVGPTQAPFLKAAYALYLLQSAQVCVSGSEQNAITTDCQPSMWPERCCWPMGSRPDCVVFGLRPAKLSRLQ